jgi:type IX secretion system PorP/SprF family membrane protein
LKKTITYLFLFAFVNNVSAQQFPVITSVDHNFYLINPGLTGGEMYSVFSLYGRKQWMGFDESPLTQSLSGHSSLNKNNFGIGGGINNDIRGVIRTTGFQLSTGYHLPLNDNLKLGFGITGNFNWYSLDFDKMRLYHPNDALLLTRGKSKMTPNFSTGIALHNDAFTIGFSVVNLLASKIKFSDDFQNNETPHYYFHTNWNIDFNGNFGINPCLILSSVNGYPLYIDFRNTFYFKSKIEFALGYRNNNEMILGAGYLFNDTWHLNYYYDVALSGVNPGIGSSHEIMITYDFYYNPMYKGSKKRYKWTKRAPKASLDGKVK